MKTNIVVFSLMTLLLGACSIKSPALYETKQKIPEIENVVIKQNVEPVKIQKKNFSIKYDARKTKPNRNNYVNTRGGIIDLNKLPSVVIALPVENKMASNEAQTLDKTGAFKTEGYINKAEEVVEKELIRAGFSVIDRSKFEAKLRTLRESNIGDTLDSKVFDKESQILKDELKNGKITDKEYNNSLAKLNASTSTRVRGKKELIDMSELIRAAQSKGIKSDYILQLNTIEEYKGYATQLKIKGNSEVENYLLNNKDISYGSNEGDIPHAFKVDIFQVVFSAKLFNVQTGKVVWTGSHKLNSLDIENILASFNISKQDINRSSINNTINTLNNRITLLRDESLSSQESLQKLYAVASKEREYRSERRQKVNEKNLKNSILEYENSIKDANSKIKEFNLQSINYKAMLKYKYIVSGLLLEPNLNSTATSMDNQKLNIIEQHRSELLRQTISSLFQTIKVRD